MKTDIGELIQIKNTRKRVGAKATYYFAILKENEHEERYMFTESQLDAAKYRAGQNKEDWKPKRTFWQKLFNKR
tara:strand:+ start:11411 stop:11632 length:222 start_codon:yes stop_codon:yes gene_type:complete